jgi:hypothetical protein
MKGNICIDLMDLYINLKQAWWLMFVLPALGRLRQEDHRFKASLDYIGIPCLCKPSTHTSYKNNSYRKHSN